MNDFPAFCFDDTTIASPPLTPLLSDPDLPEIPEIMGLVDPYEGVDDEESKLASVLGDEHPMVTLTQLIDESFIGYFNIMTHGFIGSPPIIDTSSFIRKGREFLYQIRGHAQKTGLSAFYKLTYYGYIFMCQAVVELSFCFTYDQSMANILLSREGVTLMFLLFCVYYGVEQFMYYQPNLLREIPGLVLRLSFCRALMSLSQEIGIRREYYEAGKMYSHRVQCGANVLDVGYRFRDSPHTHCGTPFDKTEYRLDVSICFRGLGMIPVIQQKHRGHYAACHGLLDSDVRGVHLPDFHPRDPKVIRSIQECRMFPRKLAPKP